MKAEVIAKVVEQGVLGLRVQDLRYGPVFLAGAFFKKLGFWASGCRV